MNTLRQEFCDEINTPMGLDNGFDYIRWLEAKERATFLETISITNDKKWKRNLN